MRRKALPVDTPHDTVDIVGTGGDGIGSVNISTGACVLAAAAGAKVAKHGNRSVSSLCGSADVLEVWLVAVAVAPRGANLHLLNAHPCQAGRTRLRSPHWAGIDAWCSHACLHGAAYVSPRLSLAATKAHCFARATTPKSAPPVQRMGVALDLGPVGAARCLEEAGVTFMFAPRFHPAMKAVVPVRRALGVRTAFNVLGPMLNPAGAKYGLVGVYNTGLARLMAEALQARRPLRLHACPAPLFFDKKALACISFHFIMAPSVVHGCACCCESVGWSG